MSAQTSCAPQRALYVPLWARYSDLPPVAACRRLTATGGYPTSGEPSWHQCDRLCSSLARTLLRTSAAHPTGADRIVTITGSYSPPWAMACRRQSPVTGDQTHPQELSTRGSRGSALRTRSADEPAPRRPGISPDPHRRRSAHYYLFSGDQLGGYSGGALQIKAPHVGLLRRLVALASIVATMRADGRA